MPDLGHDSNQSSHCAIASRQHPIQLIGTAPRVDVWLLLEYPYPWGSHVTTDNSLPPAILETLQNQLATIPNARLQFLKRDECQTLDHLTLYIGLVDKQQPILYKIKLKAITDLLQLDFGAFLRRDMAVDNYRTEKPLFVVCTNNQRDSCCARGLPIYEALRQDETIEVWQTTHIGGHRYAATLITLPHSITYGHVEAEDVAGIVTAQKQGQVYLPNMRGRTCYDPVVQVAEYFLRSQTSHTTIQALHLQAVTSVQNGAKWLVSFRADGRPYELHLVQQLADYQLPKSCLKQPEPVYEYHLIDTQTS